MHPKYSGHPYYSPWLWAGRLAPCVCSGRPSPAGKPHARAGFSIFRAGSLIGPALAHRVSLTGATRLAELVDSMRAVAARRTWRRQLRWACPYHTPPLPAASRSSGSRAAVAKAPSRPATGPQHPQLSVQPLFHCTRAWPCPTPTSHTHTGLQPPFPSAAVPPLPCTLLLLPKCERLGVVLFTGRAMRRPGASGQERKMENGSRDWKRGAMLREHAKWRAGVGGAPVKSRGGRVGDNKDGICHKGKTAGEHAKWYRYVAHRQAMNGRTLGQAQSGGQKGGEPTKPGGRRQGHDRLGSARADTRAACVGCGDREMGALGEELAASPLGRQTGGSSSAAAAGAAEGTRATATPACQSARHKSRERAWLAGKQRKPAVHARGA